MITASVMKELTFKSMKNEKDQVDPFRSARKLRSYLVTVDLYPLERVTGL